jgi:sphingolipid delta-4 desaturase
MGVPAVGAGRRLEFVRSSEDEPHAARRAAILKAHPEIKELMGFDWRMKYIVFATVFLQVVMAYLVRNASWSTFIVAAYVVGATANHSLFLAVHELAHNLGAKSMVANRLIGMVGNLPICIPYSTSFKPYHLDHHKFQGVDGMDLDVPTPLEAWFITRSSGSYVAHTVKKFLFCFFQIFFYALRPTIMKPSRLPKDRWLVLNYTICFLFDAIIVATLGPNALFYLLLSTFLAGSIHPTAGHFIAEHYMTDNGTETYSHYGWLNIFAYNVGYHNEHHDFPNIPGSRLPAVKAIAPEFYDKLPQCKSWPGIFWWYIFDDSAGPFARTTRAEKSS